MALGVTARFREALKHSHRIQIIVHFYRGNEIFLIMQNQNTLVISGEVNVQEDGERLARVTIVDPDGKHIPESFQSDFWFGREFQVYRGIIYEDGTFENIRLGIFRIHELKVTTNNNNRVMTIRGRDRSDKVRRARFTDVYQIAAGTNVGTAVRTLLEQAGISDFNFTPISSVTTKRAYQRGGDRWAAAQEIATAAGYMLYFDADGIANMQVIPNANTRATDWEYKDEEGAYPILALERTGTDDRIYNHIIVTGESDKAVVRAEASDTVAGSPTSIANFGDVPFFKVVAATTAQADAQRLADRILQQSIRGTEQVVLTIIPNPAMEINDVVYIRDALSKVDANYVVSFFSVPFERGETMTVTTNLRRNV